MANTDPVADMLSRIRNAILANKTVVDMPHSKMKQKVAEQLKKANFVDEVATDGDGITKKLVVTINKEGANPRISVIERVSKPGRRMYAKVDEIPTIRNGRGVVIVSTSKGLMTGYEAKKQKMGGELICKVY